MGAWKEWAMAARGARRAEAREVKLRADLRVTELRAVLDLVRHQVGDEPDPFGILLRLEARLAILEFELIGDLSLSAHEGLQEEIGDDLDLNPHAVVESHTGESPPSCLACGEHLFDDLPDDKEDDDLW
jgi:hypothetical protein